jgi:replicative DNA helicase
MSQILLAKDLYEKLKKDQPEVRKLAFGDSKFDEAMGGGLRPGEFVVLSGQPGMGKTEVARTWTKRLADNEIKTCWFTYEEDEQYFLEKAPTLDFYMPEVLEEDRVGWIKDHILKAKEEFGIEVAFIDNFDHLTAPEIQKQVNYNSSQYLGAIVQELQEFAKIHKVAIILIVHVVKQTHAKLNELPTRNDIADTRKLVSLPNYIIMVQRERDQNGEFTDTTKLYFEKSRRTGIHPRFDLIYDREARVLRELTASDIMNTPQIAPKRDLFSKTRD